MPSDASEGRSTTTTNGQGTAPSGVSPPRAGGGDGGVGTTRGTPTAPSRPAAWRRILHACALAGLHCGLFGLAYWAAYQLRFDFAVPDRMARLFRDTLPWVLGVKMAAFYAWGNYHGWLRHVTFADLGALVRASLLSLAALAAVDLFFWADVQVPRAALALDCVLTVVLVGTLKSCGRFSREQLEPLAAGLFAAAPAVRRAVLVTADHTGEVLVRQIHAHPELHYRVVGFLHADPARRGTRLGGIPVLGGPEDVGRAVGRAEDVLVLAGALPGRELRALMARCGGLGLAVKMVPGVDRLIAGGDALPVRDVDINDLLRRDPVSLDCGAIAELVEGRTVLVTGAGGSIGSEICRQLLAFGPETLVLLGRGENRIFAIERELLATGTPTRLVPVIADVTDRDRTRPVFERFRPDVVFHAAAHKHVPLMEANVAEAVKNNVLGTRRLADLADEYDARAFVLISTDKAVNPTSVMGACKHLAERYVHALSRESETRFVSVRFGNVLGSAGSVVPIFKEQIRRGGPVTVTDPRMTRYFMSIPEASQLVLQAAAMGQGGEIFVLDMGEPVRVTDLARDLIRLSGLPDGAVEIVYTGVRPGEKLYEELYFAEEASLPTGHPKIRAAMHRSFPLGEVRESVRDLAAAASDHAAREKLEELVPEYRPQGRAAGNTPRSPRAEPERTVFAGTGPREARGRR